MPKLTKSVVEKITPDNNRDIFIWDTALPGFGLRVFPSGKRKYIAPYRTKDNRQRRAVIGPHGVLTAESARNIAWDLLAAVKKGRDPAAETKAARQAPTVQDLAKDYLDRHAIPNKRPSSATDDKARRARVAHGNDKE